MIVRTATLAALLCMAPAAAAAQAADAAAWGLVSTWEARTPDGNQQIVVHRDLTVSFGEETVRWRVSADTIFIEFGDEWVGYRLRLEGDSFTLSGGDLEEPITLTRVVIRDSLDEVGVGAPPDGKL